MKTSMQFNEVNPVNKLYINLCQEHSQDKKKIRLLACHDAEGTFDRTSSWFYLILQHITYFPEYFEQQKMHLSLIRVR